MIQILDFNAEAIQNKLDQGLDLGLSADIIAPHKNCLYHKVVTAGRGLGFPRSIRALAILEVAFVTEEGREKGYKSGVGQIYVHPSFSGLNIASILVRNSLDLFRENGDNIVECNTKDVGAHFWQRIGWLATRHGTEHSETVFQDSVSFVGWQVLVNRLKRKPYEEGLYILKESERDVERALSLLDEDDPTSIWKFIDSGIKVMVFDCSCNRERETDFSKLVLAGEQVNSVLHLDSNMQIDCFRSRTDLLEFNKCRFDQIWREERMRHISSINADAAWQGFLPIDPS